METATKMQRFGGDINVKLREHVIKTMLARLVYEFYAPSENIRSFQEADIPTREAVDECYRKLDKHLA